MSSERQDPIPGHNLPASTACTSSHFDGPILIVVEGQGAPKRSLNETEFTPVGEGGSGR